MLKTILIICPCLFLTACLSAQEKGDNVIKVSPVSFSKVVSLLTEKGYFLDKKDNELGTAITLPKQYNVYGKMIIQVRVLDSVVYFTGTMNMEAMGKAYETYDPIEKRGMKGSPQIVAWGKIVEIASLLGSPTYGKQ